VVYDQEHNPGYVKDELKKFGKLATYDRPGPGHSNEGRCKTCNGDKREGYWYGWYKCTGCNGTGILMVKDGEPCCEPGGCSGKMFWESVLVRFKSDIEDTRSIKLSRSQSNNNKTCIKARIARRTESSTMSAMFVADIIYDHWKFFKGGSRTFKQKERLFKPAIKMAHDRIIKERKNGNFKDFQCMLPKERHDLYSLPFSKYCNGTCELVADNKPCALEDRWARRTNKLRNTKSTMGYCKHDLHTTKNLCDAAVKCWVETCYCGAPWVDWKPVPTSHLRRRLTGQRLIDRLIRESIRAAAA